MRVVVVILLIGLFQSSCLKKVEGADSLNSSIFDPEYDGGQWYVIDDISTYTNSNNDFKVRIEYIIYESVLPKLKPSGLSITADCNQYPTVKDSAELNYKGNFEGVLEYTPDGSTEYCLDLGIYLWSEDSTINRFSQCVSL